MSASKNRICPNCSRPIEGGRLDKKFCDDHCRMSYHRGGKINRSKLGNHVERAMAERIEPMIEVILCRQIKQSAAVRAALRDVCRAAAQEFLHDQAKGFYYPGSQTQQQQPDRKETRNGNNRI